MRVEAERTHVFKYTAQNGCYSHGEYYQEDDWTRHAYAETLEVLQQAAIKIMLDKSIRITSFAVEEYDALIYDGQVYEIGLIRGFTPQEQGLFITGVMSTQAYRSEMAAREAEARSKAEKEIAARDLRQRELELAQYRKLQEKYGPIGEKVV